MPASVTSTQSGDFTWATAGFAWNSLTAADRSWADAGPYAHTIEASSIFAFAETKVQEIGKSLAEPLSISDAHALSLGIRFACAITFAESYVDNIAFTVNVHEGITFGEKIDKTFEHGFGETFGVAESDHRRHVGLSVSELLTIGDQMSRAVLFWRDLVESIGLSDAVAKHLGMNKADDFDLEDAFEKAIGIGVSESLAIAEAMARTVQFKLALEEGLSLNEAATKASKIGFDETLTLHDYLVRNADAVLSDIEISSEEITEEAFASLLRYDAPTGWTNFKPLIAGDYDVKDVMIRHVIKTIGSSIPEFTHVRNLVDVPDIHNSGTASLTAAENTIAFERPYHEPPDVTVSLKGGTVFAVPRITSTAKTNFTVQLEAGDGNLVAGTITWAAKGY